MESKNIEELKLDDLNFNKGTDFGNAALERDINRDGTGRSIYIDAEYNVIAGNKTVENARKAGITKVRVIDTEGDELIAVRRTNVKLDSPQGRRMALADNAIAAANLDWDYDHLRATFDEEETLDYGVNIKNVDYSILDDDDMDGRLGDMAGGVKKAIQIEFEPDHYQEAYELVSFWRKEGAYVGKMILDFLKAEKKKV